MKLVVTGGTGLIGRPLAAALAAAGHEVAVLTRGGAAGPPPGVRAVRWPDGGRWRREVDGAGAVVHLAGEPIASRRWTPARKERIRASRIESTRAIVEALAQAALRPPVLVSASAVGYYGPHGDEEVTERDGAGTDFLGRLCADGEREACRAEALGVRVCLLRTGLVLARDGGALPRMAAPFRAWVGGPLGSGRQWVPWVHLDDTVGLIRRLIDDEAAHGPFNVVAPHPETNRAFGRALGRVLRRPSWAPVPAPLLRLALGEMAGALLLTGQRAVPARALELGYRFRHADAEGALRDLLRGG